jgi:hypothetical protein
MSEPLENPLKPAVGEQRVEPIGMPVTPEQQIPEQAATRPFEPYMAQPVSPQPPQAPSPMELAAGEPAARGAAAEVTPDSLHDGLDRLNRQVGTLKGELTPERFADLSEAQKALLKTKLGQFHQNIQGLSQRLGYSSAFPKPKGLLDDVKTVLNWLTEGQSQIENVGSELAQKGKGKISVVAMLRAQAQLLAAERAVNFATAIVSKGSDFITKIMGTQL